MKYLLLLALALGGPVWGWLTRVHERNTAVRTGAAAYAHGDASRAATAFAAALGARAQRASDPRLLLNLAHAQALANQLARARATYGRLLANTPAPVGSVARQQLGVLAAQRGEVAQALSLLRQALLLDPSNAGARFNYEVLSEYLAKRPAGPKIPPPARVPEPGAPEPTPAQNAADQTAPAEKAGADRPGKINDLSPGATAPNPPARRPSANGQADNQRPSDAAGRAVPGGRSPGMSTPAPVASGTAPGTQRGQDRTSAATTPNAPGRSTRPGTEAATPADAQLQTQRERLQAMNLSPAQARQLLETLRAQEQQYLQQLTRPAQQKPDPSKPTW